MRFGDALAREETPEAFEGAGLAARYELDAEAAIEAHERGYRLARSRGDAATAARLAIQLCHDAYAFRGPAEASGWVERAALLEASAEMPGVSERDTSGVRIPPPLFYIAGFLVGVALELAVPIERPPLAITLAGALIGGALWLALDGAAMLHFRRAGTSMVPFNPTTALVMSGPYRHTRNPMYLGMAFLYIALALAFGVIWALIVLPVVIAAVDQLVIAREEAYLVRKFGQPYCNYMTRVRRWL